MQSEMVHCKRSTKADVVSPGGAERPSTHPPVDLRRVEADQDVVQHNDMNGAMNGEEIGMKRAV